MICYFSVLNKRINSTKRPQGGTAFDITLKDDTSLLQPEIYLKWPGSGSPTEYNFCYIPDFSRYYWISNWTYTERQWAASLTVDVLSSWKTEIGASSKYVLRSAAAYDPHVLDTMYPATGESQDLEWTAAFGIPVNPVNGGAYILSVAGSAPNTPTVGGCGYYVCSPAEITNIINNAFNTVQSAINGQPAQGNNWLESILLWIGNNFIKGVSDISKFINSIMWVPLSPGDISSGSVRVFLGVVDVGEAHPLTVPRATKQLDFSLTGIDPDQDWEWMSPYAYYTFEMLPFGVVPLDSVPVLKYKMIKCNIVIDVISGIGTMKIYGVESGATMYLIAERSAQMGVPIQLGGYNINYVSALSNVVGGIASGAITGGLPGALQSGASGIGDAVKSMIPDAITDGRSGGTGALETIGKIHCRRLLHTPQDITEQGRPLCEIRTLSTLPGFILCRDGDITAPATDGELQQISQYLTGGFYYE